MPVKMEPAPGITEGLRHRGKQPGEEEGVRFGLDGRCQRSVPRGSTEHNIETPSKDPLQRVVLEDSDSGKGCVQLVSVAGGKHGDEV